MLTKKVKVPWKEGLHARPAARLVKRALSFQSSILLKANEQLTDARSFLGVLLLCASLGAVIDVEVSGVDEVAALESISSMFEGDDIDMSQETPDFGSLKE